MHLHITNSVNQLERTIVLVILYFILTTAIRKPVIKFYSQSFTPPRAYISFCMHLHHEDAELLTRSSGLTMCSLLIRIFNLLINLDL